MNEQTADADETVDDLPTEEVVAQVPPVTSMEEAQERFEDNLQAIEAAWPGLAKQIKAHKPMAELEFLENGEPDLLFKGTYLYNGEGVYTYTRKHLDAFWVQPTQLAVNTPDPNALDKHAAETMFKTLDEIKERIVFKSIGEFRESRRSYFLFLMGVGLGAHLRDMIEETGARVVTVVESNFEFIYQSLHVCDWRGLIDYGNQVNLKIEFISSTARRDIATALGGMFRKYNPTAVDGTITYQHYPSSTYKNAYQYFIEKIFHLALMGLGFFEDELHMIAQTYENLSSGSRRIMRKASTLSSMPLPAIIIGNGPSLDTNFEHLRKIQDRAVLISCGTAIDALLAHGITPDFQIQIERDVEELRLYRYTAKNHDLSKICLVASTTIFPGIAELFGETIFFFRPGLSSMPVFMDDVEERLSNPDPSVTNAGLAFALHVGFREIYFFGTDSGAKSAEHHHSKSSLYHAEDLDLPWYLDPKINISITESLDTEVPGNFGGTVLSNGILLWTKNNIESVIKVSGAGRRFYNCSDGALIEGALPLLPMRMKLPELGHGKEEIMRDFINRFPIYDRDTFDRIWEDAGVFEKIKNLSDALVEIIEGDLGVKDAAYSTKMMEFLAPHQNTDGIAMLFRGTLFLYQISMHYFINRAVTEDMADDFCEVFREHLRELIVRLRDESLQYFQDAVDKKIDYDVPHDRNAKKAETAEAQ